MKRCPGEGSLREGSRTLLDGSQRGPLRLKEIGIDRQHTRIGTFPIWGVSNVEGAGVGVH